MNNAFREGYTAYVSNKIFSSNPYPKRSLESNEWNKGWISAMREGRRQDSVDDRAPH